MYCKSSIAIVLTMSERYSATVLFKQNDTAIATSMADINSARDSNWRPTRLPTFFALTQKSSHLLRQLVRTILRPTKL
jgi:hypothetical protein